MFNKRKIFITIDFADVPGIFDYPKELPLPNQNDVIHFNDKYGRVKEVKHMTTGIVTEIKIICGRLD